MSRIFVTGLPGAGKSTVGRRVVELLGWRFFDTDEAIEQRVGCSIAQIFSEHGEAFFRQREVEALQTASSKEEVVVATGGGMVISESNRSILRTQGLTIYLSTPVEVAWQRLQDRADQQGVDTVRPLLAGADGQQKLQALYRARQQWYEEAALTIPTTTQTPEQVALQVIAGAITHGALRVAALPPQQIALDLGQSASQATVEWGGLNHLPQTLQALGFSQRVFLVTESEVGPLYAGPLKTLLTNAGFDACCLTLPAGEESKSLPFFQRMLDWLIEQKAERQEPIVALGGGVIGDLAGFVASCYLRGVPLIQVPTSLLAQVDAAIGGKTAINHPQGKNLIGAYYQPRHILVDPACLLTLPKRIYREGWGEIVKYGMVLDAQLFERLEQCVTLPSRINSALLTEIIARCIQLKMQIVQQDEREQGQRAILNYGHTFGHALETATGYGVWLHGEAVAIGMEVAARIAVSLGLLAPATAARQRELLQTFGLPIACPGAETDALLEAMTRDKKVRGGRIRWVLPTNIGRAIVSSDVPLSVVEQAIAAVTAVCAAPQEMSLGLQRSNSMQTFHQEHMNR